MKKVKETTKYQEQWNTVGNLKLELEEMDKLLENGADEKSGFSSLNTGGFFTILCC